MGVENAFRGDMEAVLGAGCRGMHNQMASFPRQPDPSHPMKALCAALSSLLYA